MKGMLLEEPIIFSFSTGSVCNFLFLEEIYREGGFPSLRASVHSSIIVSRGMMV